MGATRYDATMVKEFPYEGPFATLPRDNRADATDDRSLALRLYALRLARRADEGQYRSLSRQGLIAAARLLFQLAGLLDRFHAWARR